MGAGEFAIMGVIWSTLEQFQRSNRRNDHMAFAKLMLPGSRFGDFGGQSRA
jgi:hypothetical protein